MDYYEELGLARTASVDEIRQAYRQLARLIHPDQQPDDNLRRLAETQMKRLNMILVVLSDPALRCEYDLSLALPATISRVPHQHTLSIIERILQIHRSVWVWVAAALVGIITIWISFHYFTSATSIQVFAVRHSPVPVLEKARNDENRQAKDAVPGKLARRSVHLNRLHNVLPLPSQQSIVPKNLPPSAEPPMAQPQPASAVPAKPPASSPLIENPNLKPATSPSFAGNWLYSPSVEPTDTKGLYAPEYIEMEIWERQGQLKGRYHARYLVTDRALSPAVVFHFEGSAATPLSTMRWNGPGGARGGVTLKLLSEDLLEVSWTASRLSDELGLVSGVATLVRLKEPR